MNDLFHRSLSRLKRDGHLFMAPLFIFMFAIYFWFCTTGNWNIFHPVKHFKTELFFDKQAESICRARLDVDCQSIGSEAFVVNGKIYGYFGVTPSVLRIIPNKIFPSYYGKWARLSVLIYTFGTLLILYLIFRFFVSQYKIEMTFDNKIVMLIYFALIGLGSTNLFLASTPIIYNEATSCASFFSFASYYCLLLFVTGKKARHIALGLLFSLFALNARYVMAVDPVSLMVLCIGCSWVILLSGPSRKKGIANGINSFFGTRMGGEKPASLAAYVIAISVVLASPLCVNYAKFGHFTKLPMDKYIQYIQRPDRYQRTNGRLLSVNNIGVNMESYFGATGLTYTKEFPWMYVESLNIQKLLNKYPKAMLDNTWKTASILLYNPLLVALAFFGLIPIFRRHGRINIFRLLMISTVPGVGLILMFCFITHRYSHDLFPALFFASAAAILSYMKKSGSHSRIILYLLIAGALYGAFSNLVISMDEMYYYLLGTLADLRCMS